MAAIGAAGDAALEQRSCSSGGTSSPRGMRILRGEKKKKDDNDENDEDRC